MPIIVRKTITQNFLERVRATPDAVGFQYKPTFGPGAGRWETSTYRDFYARCRLVSCGLMHLGVEPKDRVVILANTRVEWSLCDMAILGARAVTVPIYASNLPADCAYILNHSEAKVAFVEDSRQLAKLIEKREELKNLKQIVVFDPSAMSLAAGRSDVLTLDSLIELGRRFEAREPKRFDQNLEETAPEDWLTICYTSGTTGVPKGAIITQDNMTSVMEDCAKVLGQYVEPEKEVLLSFLPFSHIIGKAESLAGYTFGWRQCFAENFDRIADNLGETKPTVFFAVPRIFEKAYGRIFQMATSGSFAKRATFERAVKVGRRCQERIQAGGKPSPIDAAEFKILDSLVFARVRERMGGRLKFAFCGGAPLPREVGEFFQIAGVRILEAYGLTETSAPVTINPAERPVFGTVGKPLPDVTIRIAEDGEILVKSRKVFKGYYKMPEETEQALAEGWFHTGDIGHIDSDGYLHITDRKKDLIITSGGKNVAPQKIENLAKSLPPITQFVVHGDKRNYLTAILTLDRDAVIRFANENQVLFSEYRELVKNGKVIGWIQRLVDQVNQGLASFETIKKFVIIADDFTVETGELTPSLKVKRAFVNRKYQAEFDRMYAAGAGAAQGVPVSGELA